MLHSIRSRLSLSHALVAFFTTLLLGGLVLVSLATYYRWREEAYLSANGAALGNLLSTLIVEQESLEGVTSQINTFSFLTQTRVRLLDTDGQELADSGSPAAQTGVATINLTVEDEDVLQTFSRQIFNQEEEEVFLTEIVISDGNQSIRATTSVFESDRGQNEPFLTPLSLFSSGFEPGVGDLWTAARSAAVFRQPIFSFRGEVIGFVELSEGPAYGQPVVLSVLVASLAAGIITFFLAGALGRWLSGRFSRPLVHLAATAQAMQTGDLSARAQIERSDEIGELAASFDQMADRLEETVTTLRRFVADAAHELTTPLTALRTNLELAQQDPAQTDYVVSALAQTDRLSRLTADLLQLSKLDHDPNIERRPVNLTLALPHWCELAAAAAEQKSVDFDLTRPAEEIFVLGNETLLAQVVGNLLDNALKFTPAGGRIEVVFQANDDFAKINFRDTGIGLGQAPNELFERFVRAPNAREYPGSGLGLAVADHLVRSHRGTVDARKLPVGSEFCVTLPRIENP